MSPEMLHEIKEKLSPKAVGRIAKKSGYTTSMVYLVLKGKRDNLKILSAIVKVYEEEMTLLRSLEERIENINL